jgi:hypothetical protein
MFMLITTKLRMLLCGDGPVLTDDDRIYMPSELKDYNDLWMFNG